MGYFVIFTFLILIVVVIFAIKKFFSDRKVISTDEYFQQNIVKVEYEKQTITIGKRTYPALSVTGIKTEYHINGKRNAQAVKIEVDDLVKPVHRVTIIGGANSADELSQRICVALRKAGGRDFV